MKISAVYKITNTVTNDFYIGSSKDVKRRWAAHKCPYTWKKQPNNPLYLDMQKYGVDKFEFQIFEEVESEHLKEVEQQFIEKLKPIYNNRRANGLDVERMKETKKKYNQSDKGKECQKKYHQTKEYKEYLKKYQKKYNQSDKGKECQKKYQKKYHQTKEYKEDHKERCKKYNNQQCYYNGKTLTFSALYLRFRRAGIENPIVEAKKYLLDKK